MLRMVLSVTAADTGRVHLVQPIEEALERTSQEQTALPNLLVNVELDILCSILLCWRVPVRYRMLKWDAELDMQELLHYEELLDTLPLLFHMNTHHLQR